MKLRIFPLIYMFMLLCNYTFCQETLEYKDKIYLRNGSILVGKVIQYDPEDSVILKIQDGNTMTFPSTMVKKVKMESKDETLKVYTFRQNTFYTRSQLSVLYKKENHGISLSQSFGFQFDHWLAAGAGIGLDNYQIAQGYNLMPVFIEIRSFLLKQNLTPYFSFRAGYGFAFADEDAGQTIAKGSFFINPTLGYRLSGGRPYIDIFCGAKFQQASYETRDSWSKSTLDYQYRRYDIGIAMTF